MRLFSDDYPYFSSMSGSFLAHAKNYSEIAINRLTLDEKSLVMEIASNDGYLLRNFVEKGIPCFGVEPTVSTAKAALDLGIECFIDFFDSRLAEQIIAKKGKVDLCIANNVIAHVPDPLDFMMGIRKC